MKMVIRSFLSRWRQLRLPALLAVLLLPGAALARDDDSNLLAQRFQFGLGTFINGSSLNIRVDGEAGEIGTPVNWGKTIGDRDESRFRFDGLWRVSERHHLRLMFTDYSSSAEREIEEEIIWDGDLIPVGVSARGTFGFEVFEAAYEYAFVKRPDVEIAGSVGLHYTQLEATLLANVQVDGEEGQVERGGTADVDAPLPVFGARGQWRLGNNFYADLLGQAFYLSVGDYTGRILNLRATVLWQWHPRLGVGIGYDWFRVDIDGDADGFQGTMDWTYEGPQAFVNVAF
ncbi:hypothetical protein [Thioalkalivibrio sp. XN279]|uniref:hypothetical protein n=1 Tax=Thioalkalivibrio sp. XN279 TaxID=2714953 RepID=UPI001408AB8A|nr:hypothetical protein [Thioalkalivibrio sp. XN279]NHA14211.1 hypothetical protein [Thioalkalivibrio sp. XN279]